MMTHTMWLRGIVRQGALVVSLGALVALAGCGSTGGATSTATSTPPPAPTSTTAPASAATATTPANATTIKITGAAGSFSFTPASVTIPVGSTVVWENSSSAPHTSTSDSGDTFTWDSSTIASGGGSFSETFTKAGTYTYHCSVHPSMHGTIIVTG